jgi:hypothetical protein
MKKWMLFLMVARIVAAQEEDEETAIPEVGVAAVESASIPTESNWQNWAFICTFVFTAAAGVFAASCAEGSKGP